MQSKLVGQSFTMTMTSSGRITDVKGFDRILDKMLEDQPEEQQELFRGRMEEMFSGDSIKSK